MNPKTYTGAQVARFTKRHTTSITRLIASGVLKGEKKNHGRFNKPTWMVTGDKDEIIAAVHKAIPRGGFRINRGGPKVKTNTPMNLKQVVIFMEFSHEARELLITLGQKANTETLEVLLGLV